MLPGALCFKFSVELFVCLYCCRSLVTSGICTGACRLELNAILICVYAPKIALYSWAAWQFHQRARLPLVKDATPEQTERWLLARNYSRSEAALKGCIALEGLSWFLIIVLLPLLFGEQTEISDVLGFILWGGVNVLQMIALFFTLNILGVIKWPK